MRVVPDYSDRRWTVAISTELPLTMRSSVDADTAVDEVDCVISGAASDIYLALWNRVPLDTLRIEGDRGVIDLVREVHIRWG